MQDKYRILALDIDGTLAHGDRSISEYTQQTLIQAQKQGIRIVIASGRPAFGISPIADQLRLADYGGYVLAYNGGEIWNWQTKLRIYEKPLPADSIPLIYDACRRVGVDVMTYCGSEIITEAKDNPYILLSSKRNRMQLTVVPSFLQGISYPIFKCMIVGEPERLQEFEPRLNAGLEGRAVAFRSEPFYLEVVPTGIDKATCLEVILSHLGLDRSSLIACGDGYNDISMIRFAGLGVAMENANDQVKQSADYITLSNEADGVAHVVNKFLLS